LRVGDDLGAAVEERPAGPGEAEHQDERDDGDVPRGQRPSAAAESFGHHCFGNPSTSHLLITPQLLVADRSRRGSLQPGERTEAIARIGRWAAASDLHARESTSLRPLPENNFHACGNRT
jgi:hypothetical protein